MASVVPVVWDVTPVVVPHGLGTAALGADEAVHLPIVVGFVGGIPGVGQQWGGLACEVVGKVGGRCVGIQLIRVRYARGELVPHNIDGGSVREKVWRDGGGVLLGGVRVDKQVRGETFGAWERPEVVVKGVVLLDDEDDVLYFRGLRGRSKRGDTVDSQKGSYDKRYRSSLQRALLLLNPRARYGVFRLIKLPPLLQTSRSRPAGNSP